MRRAIDYLESRPDVDHERIAFYGLSMGADDGAIVGAVENRLRTLVLVAAGLDDGLPPEVDGLNFAPRVRMPVLMDQRPVRLHGAARDEPAAALPPPRARRRRTRSTSSSTAATCPPWPDVVRETLDWLDRYLGPVATGPPGP